MKKIRAELHRSPKQPQPLKPSTSTLTAAADLKKVVLVLLEGLKLDAAAYQLAIFLNAENLAPVAGTAWTVQGVESALANLRSPRHELYGAALDLATAGEITYSDFSLLCQSH